MPDTRVPPHLRLNRADRLVLAAICVGLAGIFAVAVFLTPDKRGFGTHEQLGFPPCRLKSWTGVGCPHCGMTTSFAHFVRGQWQSSWTANPLGPPLAVVWALCLPYFIGVLAKGRWIGLRNPQAVFVTALIGFAVLSLVVWGVRLLN